MAYNNGNGLLSPDGDDTFSTPPTSPRPVFAVSNTPPEIPERPTLSRKNSRLSNGRPSSLNIDPSRRDWQSDIVLEETSPGVPKKNNTIVAQHSTIITPTSGAPSSSPAASVPQRIAQMNKQHQQPMRSPCFVHSHLDKGASLTDWLRNKQNAILGDVGIASSLQRTASDGTGTVDSSPTSGDSSAFTSNDEDDDYGGSLTRQLAETAVGVREMSKQLGRARVRSNIQSVLIITKARDNRLIKLTRELALYLMLKLRPGQARGMVVYVDNQLRNSRRFDAEGIERDHPELFVPFPRRRTSSTTSLSSMNSAQFVKEHEFYLKKEEGQLRYWTSDMCSHSPHLFDFVVTLGGDGTVLFTSWLFQRIVPPVLPFALGSLGFLTNFDFADHAAVMDSVIDNGIRVNLRMRFTCTVYRAVANEGKGRKAVKKGETGEILMKNIEEGGWEALEGGWNGGFSMNEGPKSTKDKEIMCFVTRPVETFEILNDLVVDRGPSPYVSLLELFGDEHHMTTVQADGLTVSTPTGSTAYSLSAGGSLVHPEIPALLITPICPHTLSFRPMLLPDSMELRICVPFNSRSTAWASFDGRGRVELKQGDHIKVTASKYPFPTVCHENQSTDWFHAISRTLKWNERERQKSFVVVEEGPAKPKKKKHTGHATPDVPEETLEDEEEDEVSDEEEEEDKFDIDDSSPEALKSKVPKALTPGADAIAIAKAEEAFAEDTLHAALLHSKKNGKRAHTRHDDVHSGIQTPSRFAGPEPHMGARGPSPRHRVEFDLDDGRGEPGESNGHRGERDDLYSPKKASGKSRIPNDRDVDLESVKTPTAATQRRRRGKSRSRSRDPSRRTFAVWGQDESDSAASDSDA